METEIVPNTFPAMFWGYAAIWGLLAAYIISLGVRVRQLELRLKAKE